MQLRWSLTTATPDVGRTPIKRMRQQLVVVVTVRFHRNTVLHKPRKRPAHKPCQSCCGWFNVELSGFVRCCAEDPRGRRQIQSMRHTHVCISGMFIYYEC